MSEWGVQVDDPCKAEDTRIAINITRGQQAERDLKYHSGTDSDYWLMQCNGLKSLRLTQPFSFLSLTDGNLVMHRTPPDECTMIKIKHRAPDNSVVKYILYIKMLAKDKFTIKECSPQEGQCSPNIDKLLLSSVAGQTKTVILHVQDSLGLYRK